MNTFRLAPLALLVAGLGIGGSSLANEGRSPPAPASETHWKPIDPARLAGMRGGLQLPSGLSVSFGFERAVYLNGELIADTRLRIADAGRITPEQAQALAELNRGLVVQIGPDNRLETPAGGALVIQNSLDGQDIRALTTIDIGVGTLDMFQQLNAADALSRAQSLMPGGL